MSCTDKNYRNTFSERPTPNNSKESETKTPSNDATLQLENSKQYDNSINDTQTIVCCLTNEVIIDNKIDDESSEELMTEATAKLNKIFIGKPPGHLRRKQRGPKNQSKALVVSLRYGKSRGKNKSRKTSHSRKEAADKKKSLKTSVKNKNVSEKRAETPKKGKRGRLGGKAKGKPPQEETTNKCESDEESEIFYFNRISLGHFQQLKDRSGASTSNQPEDDFKEVPLLSHEELENKNSEEIELLELQKWGMSSLNFCPKINDELDKLDTRESTTGEHITF